MTPVGTLATQANLRQVNRKIQGANNSSLKVLLKWTVKRFFFCAICDITFLVKALSSWHEYQPHFSWCFANCAKLPSRLGDKEAAKDFLTGRLILPCAEKMYGNSMAASVCNRQNATRVSMALWKKRKFWHDERIEKQLVISFHLYGLNSRTNSFFSSKSNCLETKPKIQGYAITGKFVCFCVSAKCPKHSFLIMSLKKRKKNSGNHFMPSAGTFIKSPDCACIK